ncbi:MAG: zinc-ribbon domain-containing protein [Methanoregula sp.]|nr:zinc-ribbon domain-containing protein [Methanoregula sp.]
MDEPELYGNERILIRTANVHVKSISFEAILTNKRIIFINRVKNILSQKEIPLVTVQGVETGENAIRDTLITLTIVTNSRERKQMVLTFSRESGGNRAKERNEWVKLIDENINPSFEHVVRTVIPGIDPAEKAGPVPPKKINITRSPLPPTPTAHYVPATKPQPVKTNSETQLSSQATAPAAAHGPVPMDSPFVTLGTYCSKCGAKVPDNSMFCDKCGSRIIVHGAVPQVPLAISTPAASVQTVEQPIDHEIQSVEPLIERSSVKVNHDSLYAVLPEPAPVQEMRPAADPADAQPQKKVIPQFFTPKDLSQSLLVHKSMPPAKPRSTKKLAITIGIIIVIIIAIAAVAFVVMNPGSIESILPAFNSSGSSTNATGSSTAATNSPMINNKATSITKTVPATQVTVVTTKPMINNKAASIV